MRPALGLEWLNGSQLGRRVALTVELPERSKANQPLERMGPCSPPKRPGPG
jgi:hypothetical protein